MTTVKEKSEQAMSAEQMAERAALDVAAREEAAQAAALIQTPANAEAAPETSEAEEWAALPQMFGAALAIGLPELQAVYTPEACRAWGESMVPVARKYGWDAAAIMGVEMGLLAASLPFIVGTVGAIKARRAKDAMKPDKEAAKAAAQSVPGQKIVTFGGIAAPVQ